MNEIFEMKLFGDKEKALKLQKEMDGELLDFNNPKDRDNYIGMLIISEGSFDPDVPKLFPYCVSWIKD